MIIHRREQLMTQDLLKRITFTQDNEDHVNDQIVMTFPCLIETGWICYKTKSTSELELMPFEPDSAKDLNYIKRYFIKILFNANSIIMY